MTWDATKRSMLRHFLAAIAYRAQKALRDAPESYASFHAGMNVRTPHELVRHIASVLGYARTLFVGGTWRPRMLPTFREEIARLHEVIEDLPCWPAGHAPAIGWRAGRAGELRIREG